MLSLITFHHWYHYICSCTSITRWKEPSLWEITIILSLWEVTQLLYWFLVLFLFKPKFDYILVPYCTFATKETHKETFGVIWRSLMLITSWLQYQYLQTVQPFLNQSATLHFSPRLEWFQLSQPMKNVMERAMRYS